MRLQACLPQLAAFEQRQQWLVCHGLWQHRIALQWRMSLVAQLQEAQEQLWTA